MEANAFLLLLALMNEITADDTLASAYLVSFTTGSGADVTFPRTRSMRLPTGLPETLLQNLYSIFCLDGPV